MRPENKEKNRTRATLGGNRVNYPGDVGTPTADMLLFKVLLNSVVSTPGAKFIALNVSNFYLNTPMDRFEYVKLRLTDMSKRASITVIATCTSTIDGTCIIFIKIDQFLINSFLNFQSRS